MVWQTIPDLNIFKRIVLRFFLLTLINQPNPYFVSHRQSLSDSARWWLQYIHSCLHFLVALILSFFLLCSYHKYSPHSSQSCAGFFNPWLSFFIYLFIIHLDSFSFLSLFPDPFSSVIHFIQHLLVSYQFSHYPNQYLQKHCILPPYTSP